MAAPANYVVVRDGNWTLSHSGLGAYEIVEDAALGPDLTLRYLTAWQDTERAWNTSPKWITESSGEGGLLVDYDRRVLMLFSVYFDQASRAAFFDQAPRRWPGWEVRWAHNGISDLLAHLGLPRIATDRPDRHSPAASDPDLDLDRARWDLATSLLKTWAFFLVEDVDHNYQEAYHHPETEQYYRERGLYRARERTALTRRELSVLLEDISGHPQPDPRWPAFKLQR